MKTFHNVVNSIIYSVREVRALIAVLKEFNLSSKIVKNCNYGFK